MGPRLPKFKLTVMCGRFSDIEASPGDVVSRPFSDVRASPVAE
jgi:hypothetical protein